MYKNPGVQETTYTFRPMCLLYDMMSSYLPLSQLPDHSRQHVLRVMKNKTGFCNCNAVFEIWGASLMPFESFWRIKLIEWRGGLLKNC